MMCVCVCLSCISSIISSCRYGWKSSLHDVMCVYVFMWECVCMFVCGMYFRYSIIVVDMDGSISYLI